MPAEIPDDSQKILNQLHSDVFLERLKDHLDPDGKSDLNVADPSDLIDLARRLQVQDRSSSIDSKAGEMLLKDEEFRDYLLEAIRSFMKPRTEELEEKA